MKYLNQRKLSVKLHWWLGIPPALPLPVVDPGFSIERRQTSGGRGHNIHNWGWGGAGWRPPPKFFNKRYQERERDQNIRNLCLFVFLAGVLAKSYIDPLTDNPESAPDTGVKMPEPLEPSNRSCSPANKSLLPSRDRYALSAKMFFPGTSVPDSGLSHSLTP